MGGRAATGPSVVESTARFIAESLASGRYRSGDRLVEADLTARYRVSRSTVRAALRELACRGLVTLHQGRSATVSELTDEDAIALYDLRAVVEPLLIARFTERASRHDIRDLEEAFRAFDETAQSSDELRRVFRARDTFYDVLLRGASSWALGTAVRTEYSRLTVFRRTRIPEEVELSRLRAAARRIHLVIPPMQRRETVAAHRFCARQLIEDGAATMRLIRAQREVAAAR